MSHKKKVRTPETIWAYSYELHPPQTRSRLRDIRTVLEEEEHAQARSGSGTWRGRLVEERQITHILVLSVSPDQHRDVNVRLEAELGKLEAGFSVTLPVPVVEEPATTPAVSHPSA